MRLLGHLSVGQKILAMTLLYLLAVAGLLAYSVVTVQAQRTDKVVQELVAHQRVLNQRHLNEVLLASAGGEADVRATRQTLLETQQVLGGGGKVSTLLEMRESVEAPAPEEAALKEKIEAQKQALDDLIAGTDAYLELDPTARHPTDRERLLQLGQTMDRLTAQVGGLVREQGERRLEILMWVEILLGLTVLVAGGLLSWLVSREILAPLGRVVEVSQAVSTGDLTHKVVVSSQDELGTMGRSLNRALERMRYAIQTIGEHADFLAGSSEELAAVSRQMSGSASDTFNQASAVSTSSEQVSRSVEQVAAGIEEVSASIREIAKNADEAARIGAGGAEAARTTNETVERLGESSAQVGQIIKLITTIAEQTDLLALNATIEAARAGDAGKGFAVVASEVKELANETGRAADQVSERIEAIQADIRSAVEEIGQITDIISQINAYQNNIATAVEEQAVTTGEIGKSVAEAVGAASEIAQSVAVVADVARNTSGGAEETQRAAAELARKAGGLRKLVGQFQVVVEEPEKG